eukprot:13360398-Ditylum_brightwellii.AAC.1
MNMRDWILLDSNSTDTVFCNEKYVSNVRRHNRSSSLTTNAGVLTCDRICDVSYLGTHWFNKEAMTNVISLAHMASKY